MGGGMVDHTTKTFMFRCNTISYPCRWVSQSVSRSVIDSFGDSYRVYRDCELVLHHMFRLGGQNQNSGEEERSRNIGKGKKFDSAEFSVEFPPSQRFTQSFLRTGWKHWDGQGWFAPLCLIIIYPATSRVRKKKIGNKKFDSIGFCAKTDSRDFFKRATRNLQCSWFPARIKTVALNNNVYCAARNNRLE